MTSQQIHEILKEKFAGAIFELNAEALQPYINIAPGKVDEIAEFLRDDPRLSFDFLMCLSGIDLAENLGVVYHLYSMTHTHKIVLHTEVSKEKPDVQSVVMLWRTADWHEREAYDMLGINFLQHPDLSRILLPDDWEGYPLRKDYVQPEVYGGIHIAHPDKKEDVNDSE